MIENYKKISIVYGGSGGIYAKTLNDMINNYEKENRYPISSRIVMEQILTDDILSQVTALFRDTQVCIAILTAEDCCVKDGKTTLRLRQNVVFELGMALFHLGRERCILLSDFTESDNVELPSDIGKLEIKRFNKQNQNEVFQEVLIKVLQLSKSTANGQKDVAKHDYLLTRDKYFVDYASLFSRYDSIVSANGKNDVQEILRTWLKECKELKYFDEKLMYAVERIAFLPMFGMLNANNNWYKQIEAIIGEYDEHDVDYYGGSSVLKFCKTVFDVANRYTELKMIEGKNPELYDFEELLSDATFNEMPTNCKINPLVEILYHNYKGLLYMHVYSRVKDESMLEKAKDCYEKIVNDLLDKVDLSLSVWGGFLYFNLARVYAKIFATGSQKVTVDKVLRTFERAISVRKKWITSTGLTSLILSSLSSEYFIAKIEYIYHLKLLRAKSDEQIEYEYKKLEGELESYCNNDEKLERLIFVQDMLQNYRANNTALHIDI